MMEQLSLDPYEQQLLKVFDSHDRDNLGSLDREGLTQLCQTLQLEEQGTELIKCLLNDPKHTRATFIEFKDALLALLGNMQNNKTNEDSDINEVEKSSPDREVSPKYVYGSKKYGRRSRPRNDETPTIFGEQNDLNYLNKPTNTSVQRSNSQTEVSNSKKRKTNYKLKRCTSLPGHNDLSNIKTPENTFFETHTLSSEPELICTEDMLREAWKKLGVGEDGYLNQEELILVCDAIGLHKLADGVIRQLSDKFSVNYNHKISFQELLETLQQDETWFEVFNSPPSSNESVNLQRSTDNLFPDSRTFQYITLGPDGNGIISTDTLIEMWETVGIHSPKQLIHELGFNSRRINIVELADVLEKQIKGINDSSRSNFQSPHIALLQANLTLYQSEIRCLKNVLEQMYAEREKLKCDVLEANNRATLLAQEVDDNHSRMEQNTLNQVKLLEQRHSDILKEVTQQYSKDKEQLSVINQSLEERITNLELEINKLKNDLVIAQKYSLSVEKETQVLASKINELEGDKKVLTEQIGALENEKQNFGEIKVEENEILLAKLSALQMENSQLKDKNDEMVSTIESLSNQVTSMRSKGASTPTFNTLDQSMEENISIICEGVGLGAKRRSDYSPTKDANMFNLTDGSPRLGKVRKFHRCKGDNYDVPFTSSESGFDTELDCFDSSLSVSTSDNQEITRLQAKVAFLEQILTQNSIPIPATDSSEQDGHKFRSVTKLTERIQELEHVIRCVKAEMHNMIQKKCVSSDDLKFVTDKLEHFISEGKETSIDDSFETNNETLTKTVDASIETEKVDLTLENKIKQITDENQELSAKCNELENCVELLRNEYEKCEDYWQTKLDEERQMFEQEQKQNSEKLTDLIIKMKEYEDQFTTQDMTDNRLPTIEETYNLEKQFTDLEQEYEEYKVQSETELFRRDEEISILKEKLTELAIRQTKVVEAGVQVEESLEQDRILNKMRSFSSYVVENTNLLPEEAIPPQLSPPVNHNVNPDWTQGMLPNNQTKTETSDISTTSTLPVNWNFTSNDTKTQTPCFSNVPSTSSSSTLEKNSTPCRPKRTRKHDKNVYKKNNQDKDVKKTDSVSTNTLPQQEWKGFQSLKHPSEQTVAIPISALHNLHSRRTYLEQRVRHLQGCLKQQHYHTEQTLQYYWQQFRGDKADLNCKLKHCQEKLEQQVRICNEQLDKLERTDLLVKELFVENSYLIANVQRLEQQCHMLAQCNSNSSSV